MAENTTGLVPLKPGHGIEHLLVRHHRLITEDPMPTEAHGTPVRQHVSEGLRASLLDGHGVLTVKMTGTACFEPPLLMNSVIPVNPSQCRLDFGGSLRSQSIEHEGTGQNECRSPAPT